MIRFEHFADLTVTIGSPVEVGNTPAGLRRLVPITGGDVRGEKLRGRILPLGADYQVIRPDGVIDLDARYAIETHDSARIYVHNTGLRHGSDENAYFRTTPRFEAAEKPYLWLNRFLFAAEAVRHRDTVEITIWQLL